ncbi:MAG TPA: oxygenase MpaB family protein [Acidimicrobiales bacterium]
MAHSDALTSAQEAAEFRRRRHQRRRQPIPGVTGGAREDDGLYGPDTITWRVWSKPTAIIAAYRATIVQMMLPPVATGVNAFSTYRSDTLGRARRTGHYFAAVALGDRRTATETARFVNALHRQVSGVEPSTGRVFTADEPDLAMYVHVTSWQSALAVYERYYGRLSDSDRDAFYTESARGSALVGVPAREAPATHAEVREYYRDMRPQLWVNLDARAIYDWFMRPQMTWDALPTLPAWEVIKRLAIPTIPRWMREATGIDQPRSIDVASLPVGAVATRALEAQVFNPLFRMLLPEAHEIQQSALARMREHRAERRRARRATRGRSAASHHG